MPIPGINVTESAISVSQPSRLGIRRIYVIGYSTNNTAADLNTPILVKTLTEFTTRFPGAADILVASIRAIFRNFAEAEVYFISGKDTAVADPLSPAHLVFALDRLKNRTDLDLGFLIIPAMSSLTTQADRTNVFSNAESFCNKLDWLFLANTAIDTDTKAEALTERALYASPQGHSALYYGLVIDPEAKSVPVAAFVAAIAVRRVIKETPFSPPGGEKYPLQGVSSLIGYVDNIVDYNDLQTQNINVLQRIPESGVCIWGARTLSTNVIFSQVNTRMAISVTSRRIERTVQPLLFESVDPQGYIRREVVRRVVSILQTIFLNNGLSGSSPEQAYRVEEVVTTETNLRKIQIKIFGVFVGTLEEIEIQLISVDAIPTLEINAFQ